MWTSVCRLAAIGLLGVTACNESTAPEEDALRSARSRWASNGPTAYHYDLARSCECTPEMAGPVRVYVQGGNVLRREYIANQAPVSAQYASSFPSVVGLFDVIASALRDGAYRVEVDYDPDNGLPRVIAVDYDRAVADDEFVYSATNLSPSAIN
ncbi:MAG: DUF6174 domain-containing protein [Gemmatimonadota bacterium]